MKTSTKAAIIISSSIIIGWAAIGQASSATAKPQKESQSDSIAFRQEKDGRVSLSAQDFEKLKQAIGQMQEQNAIMRAIIEKLASEYDKLKKTICA